jgi:hypothetical protein
VLIENGFGSRGPRILGTREREIQDETDKCQDIVQVLTANGFSATFGVPSKIEGLTFGKDIHKKGKTLHTLWIANDNDFVLATNDTPSVPNPNQFFVFGFSDSDLGGSKFVAQFPNDDGGDDNQGDEN